MGAISTFIFKVVDDENKGAFKSPGVILSRQNDNHNEGTDTENKFRCFRHFRLITVEVVIILLKSF